MESEKNKIHATHTPKKSFDTTTWIYRISPVFVHQISANVSCSWIYFYIYCANYCSVFVPARAVLVQKLNNNSTGEVTGSTGSPGVTRSGLTGYFFYQKNPRCGPVPVPPPLGKPPVWSGVRYPPQKTPGVVRCRLSPPLENPRCGPVPVGPPPR